MGKGVHDILNVLIKNQILRIEKLVDTGPVSSNPRKRPFDDITNTNVILLESSIPTTSPLNAPTKVDDTIVLNEADHVLKHSHILTQWYLGILQQTGKQDSQDDYLLCKVVKKGVTDAEEHAIKILDYVQEHHLKRLELTSYLLTDKNETLDVEQRKTTLKITDMIYAIKIKHMMKAIINIYAEFRDIALKLYESNK